MFRECVSNIDSKYLCKGEVLLTLLIDKSDTAHMIPQCSKLGRYLLTAIPTLQFRITPMRPSTYSIIGVLLVMLFYPLR